MKIKNNIISLLLIMVLLICLLSGCVTNLAAADGDSDVVSANDQSGTEALGTNDVLSNTGDEITNTGASSPITTDTREQSDSISLQLILDDADEKYSCGEIVTAGVWLSAAEPLSFGSFQTDIVYPTQQLSVIDLIDLADGFIANKDYQEDTALLVYYPNENQLVIDSQPIKIATVCFTVNDDTNDGSYQLKLGNISFFTAGTAEETVAEDFVLSIEVE